MKRLLIIAAVICLALASTAAAMPGEPHLPDWRSAHVTVEPGGGIVHWQTNEHFADRTILEAGIYVDGHELRNEMSSCAATEQGHGAVVMLNSCGPGRAVPLKIKAFSADGKRHGIVVVFRQIGRER